LNSSQTSEIGKMERSKKITVVVASDEHYLPMLATLIKSIEANLSRSSLLDLWIIGDRITTKNKLRIENSVNHEISVLHWKDADKIIPSGMELPLDKSSFPLSIYLWYFIPFFIPTEIEKVIYLDVDMLNYRDLTELWDTDLGNKIAGAVVDPRIRTFECDWGGILNYQELGFTGSYKYFNSGVMLINTHKWMKNHITEKALVYVEDNYNSAVYPEQYGLNLALANNWIELNPLWNYFATTSHKAPYNVHFVDRKPIYITYKNNPVYLQQFQFYLLQTDWADFKPIGELKRYMKKINNVIEKKIKRITRKFSTKKKQSL